jgi:hypothetical protein
MNYFYHIKLVKVLKATLSYWRSIVYLEGRGDSQIKNNSKDKNELSFEKLDY